MYVYMTVCVCVCLCQSFCSALNQELTEYYRLVALLEAQVCVQHVTNSHIRTHSIYKCTHQVQRCGGDSEGDGGLTLQRVRVWTHEPRQRLQMLAVLVDTCKCEYR